MNKTLKSLITYSKNNSRICPQPMKWNELWQILPDRKRKGQGWEPHPPLILAAWWETSPSEKRNRFEQHLIYAEEKGVLQEVDKFLRSLPEDQWFHEND